MKHKDLLLMRAIILNFAGAILLYWGWDSGVLPGIISKDTTYITSAIILLFFYGLGLCLYRVYQVQQELNAIAELAISDVAFDRMVTPICRVSSTLVALGIIGTIYGIIMALTEANLANLTNVSTVGSELSVMVNGLMTMFVTTIAGLTASTWLGLNIQLLENGYRQVYLHATPQ